MTQEPSNNLRLAKNTLTLYFRMLMSMLVSLYTSRVTLEVLGVEDYGIYNVVAGIVVLFSFLNGTMATATQRFLSFEIGKGNIDKLIKTFSVAFWIHIIIALMVAVVSEVGGLWLLYNKMVIPESRMFAALIVFQVSILTTIINITQVPYNAAIVAHEKFVFFAYLSICDVVLKLLLVWLLQWINSDKLILYAVLMLGTSIISITIARIYSIKNFKECHIHKIWDSKIFKELFSFAGWNLSAQIADIGRTQGVNIILNIFFGPLLNAARGISVTVNGVITQFVTNFMAAMNPQIVKYYAKGEKESMFQLVRRGCKYSSFLLLVLISPVLFETHFILNLWLKNPPLYAAIFCRLILVASLINALSSTIFFAVMASGQIKRYQLVMSGMILTVPIFVYIGYKFGLPSYSCLFFEIFACVLSLFLRPLLSREVTGFPIKKYLTESVFPVILVAVISLPLPAFLYSVMSPGWIRFLVVGLVCEICLIGTIYFFGMSKSEKFGLINFVRNKYFHQVKSI